MTSKHGFSIKQPDHQNVYQPLRLATGKRTKGQPYALSPPSKHHRLLLVNVTTITRILSHWAHSSVSHQFSYINILRKNKEILLEKVNY